MVPIDTDPVDKRPVRQIATRSVVVCDPDTPVSGAAERMRGARCSSIVIVRDQRPVGIWTERDALALDLDDASAFDRPVGEVMSWPLTTIHAERTIGDAWDTMRASRRRHLVVLDEQEYLFGIVTQTDLIFNQGVETFLVLRGLMETVDREPLHVAADLPVAELVRLMRLRSADAAVVGDNGDGRGPGIVTERDVLGHVAARQEGLTADVLASRPLVGLPSSECLLQARNVMLSEQVRHLAVTGEDGAIVGLLSFSDIMASVQTEYVAHLSGLLRERDQALKASMQNLTLAKKVIDVAEEAIVITNDSGEIQFVNPAFTKVTGYEADEVLGNNPSMLQSGRHGPAFYREMWQRISRDGRWQGEIWNRRKNGEIYPEWLTITALAGQAQEGMQYVAVFSDISDRKRDENSIRKLAYFDQLTGLPNRRLFADRLGMSVARSRRSQGRLAVLYLDLDGFKRINDSLGQDAGDRVLRMVTARLRDVVGEGDSLARIAGDEFALLVNEPDGPEAAAHLAAQLMSQLQAPVELPEVPVYLSASIGIAVYPEDGDTAEALLRNADTAMTRAKDSGRNRFSFYTAALSSRSKERLSLDSDLRTGLARGELFLVHQPKYCAMGGHIDGLEALVRWEHPKRGLVGPGEFITLAEETGFIVEIGDWVIREAATAMVRWRENGFDPGSIAVNVSPLQFHSPGFPDRVEQILTEVGLSPQHLDLEITEGLLLSDLDGVAATLKKLRDLGIGIAIDDFGTGFSSFAYLKRLPIDYLKIDQVFVRDMFTGSRDEGLVETMIMLARNLGLRSVAEGVETEAQRQFLRARGCDLLQGYLTGRPMSAEQIELAMSRSVREPA